MTISAARRRPRIGCVVLAAGESRRLGAPKQLLRHHGRPLLLGAVSAARGALPHARVVVVLGPHVLRLRALLRREAPYAAVATNAHWRHGMASSLQAGLRSAGKRADALLVLLVDQPGVTADSVRRLIAAWRLRPAVPAAAYYAGRPGVPAMLPRSTWRSIRALQGDAGARVVLRAASAVTLVPMPEAAFDVDTPEDASRLA